MKSSHSMDLTTGSVFKKLLIFMLPILATNLLQQFYSAADTIVVGQFASQTALAAVGATGAVSGLLLNFFTGTAVGTNVICANLFGARKHDDLKRYMHTAIFLGAVIGLIIGVVGFCLARPLLQLMGCPENVIDQSTLYMKIIFCGAPVSALFNFAAGILRAHGDTRRPMTISIISGLVNVVLNLVFVIFLHMDVAGVALATIISQAVSAVLGLRILFAPKGEFQMQVRQLRLGKTECAKILAVGIPCAFNAMVFSISNVTIQSTVNSFGDIVMSGSAAASNIEGFVFQIIGAAHTACVSFSGQCFGAKQYKRIDSLWKNGFLLCTAFVSIFTIISLLAPEMLIGLYTRNPDVIAAGSLKLVILSSGYFLYICSEISIGCMRGMGKTTAPTVLNFACICLPRVIWVFLIFPLWPTATMLYICYPVSWLISSAVQTAYFLHCRKKLYLPEPAASNKEATT